MKKTMETVEPGIFRRVDPRSGKVLPRLWIHYPGREGHTEREPTHTTSIVQARKLRAKRLEQHGRGEPGRSAEEVRVNDLLDALVTNYAVNRRASQRTLKSHLEILRPAIGHLRAIDCTMDVIERWQLKWQEAGTTAATVNRRCTSLRRAFSLAQRARKVHFVPYVPRLAEHSERGRYIAATDATVLADHLPVYLYDFFAFAYDHGARKGQLARTLRRFVDLDRGLVVWPPDECKAREAHTVPLEGAGLRIVQRLMGRPPLWCPYLFHGPRCAPGRAPSKVYGCIGDFKKAWTVACRKAGFPVGRRAGGYVFHHTRNTAATNLRAGGVDEADCMKVGGWKTAHVFKHYDLGNVDALRERLARARKKTAVIARLAGTRRRAVRTSCTAGGCERWRVELSPRSASLRP
jgi:integrase